MSAPERTYLPPVECAPWCEYGDGHPSQWSREDQACWSPDEYVDLSLEPVLHEEGWDYPHRLGVMVRREPDSPGAVYLHLDNIKIRGPVPEPYGYLDQSLNLTPYEAIQLGGALIREAAMLLRSGRPTRS